MKAKGAAFLAAALLSGGLGAAAARAEVVQERGVRVAADAELTPRKLPRRTSAPVAISFAGRIAAAEPTQLQGITIALNAHGRLDTRGLPRCQAARIDPASTREALAECRSSLVGRGRFAADVRLPEQSPFPSVGRVLAFNGTYRGNPAILAHIYGTRPVPTSYLLPFAIARTRGTYGTVLEARLPQVTSAWGSVRAISMSLHRFFGHHGARHSYVSAGCPAPEGFPGAVFPLARTSFHFSDGQALEMTLTRSCRARGG